MILKTALTNNKRIVNVLVWINVILSKHRLDETARDSLFYSEDDP